MDQTQSPQVNADDVISIMGDQISDLAMKYAYSEARRLYLEKRVAALQLVVEQQTANTPPS